VSSNHNTSFLDHLGEPRTRMSNRSQFAAGAGTGVRGLTRGLATLPRCIQEPMSETGMEDTQDDRISSIQITTTSIPTLIPAT